MKYLRSGLRAGLAIAFCAALFAPPALADSGKKPEGERPGNSANAPGHDKGADGPAPAATPVQPASPPSPAAPEDTPPAATPADATEGSEAPVPPPAVQAPSEKHSKPEKNEPPAKKEKAKPEQASRPGAAARPAGPGRSAGGATAHSKVLICHATGSATNPYVLISVSVNAWSKGSGHGAHAADVFVDWSWPGDPRQKNDALCPRTGPVDPPTSTTGTTTTTPSAPSTHSDHEGQASIGTSPTESRGRGPTLAPPVSKKIGTSTAEVRVRSGRLAGAAVRGTLPFTGLPLWAVGLVALALIGLGLVLRRRSRHMAAMG